MVMIVGKESAEGWGEDGGRRRGEEEGGGMGEGGGGGESVESYGSADVGL